MDDTSEKIVSPVDADVPGWGDVDPDAFARLARIWDALGAGPLWLARETTDPLLGVQSAAPSALNPVRTAPRRAGEFAPARPAARPAPQPAGRPAAQTPSRAPDADTLAAPAAHAPSAPVPILAPEVLARIASADWETLRTIASSCTACPMARSRQHVVFSEGVPGPKLVLVGEAPGGEEDLQGLPFVGKSGKLLTAMLEAIGVKRVEDVVILNALKCRPPGNRNPEPAEMACCRAYLNRQLELLKPEVLFLMGRFASQSLLGVEPSTSIASLRGRVHNVMLPGGTHAKAVVTYHPSYLLRSPGEKAKAWQDLVMLKHLLG